jgi:hypothetical protein
LHHHQHQKFLTSATHVAATAAVAAVVVATVKVVAVQAVVRVAVAATMAAPARVVGQTSHPAKSAHALASLKVKASAQS